MLCFGQNIHLFTFSSHIFISSANKCGGRYVLYTLWFSQKQLSYLGSI